jgi:6-phosphogluconolactonase
MTSAPTVSVVADKDVLAASVAARLVTRLADAQARRGSASVVLTGGGVGIASLAAVRTSPARGAVDWRKVDVWWGDERFVPADDPERNERQAREALLDALDLDPARVHPMGARGGPDGDDADAAAARYARSCSGPHPPTTRCRRSTCCCSAWAARGTPRRSSRVPGGARRASGVRRARLSQAPADAGLPRASAP